LVCVEYDGSGRLPERWNAHGISLAAGPVPFDEVVTDAQGVQVACLEGRLGVRRRFSLDVLKGHNKCPRGPLARFCACGFLMPERHAAIRRERENEMMQQTDQRPSGPGVDQGSTGAPSMRLVGTGFAPAFNAVPAAAMRWPRHTGDGFGQSSTPSVS